MRLSLDLGLGSVATLNTGGAQPLFDDTFTDGDDGWFSDGTGVFSVVSGVGQVTGVSNFAGNARRLWTGLEIGHSYTVELDFDTGGLDAAIRVAEASGAFAELYFSVENTSGLTAKSFEFTATTETAQVVVIPYAGDAGQIARFDNVRLFF